MCFIFFIVLIIFLVVIVCGLVLIFIDVMIEVVIVDMVVISVVVEGENQEMIKCGVIEVVLVEELDFNFLVSVKVDFN